MAKFYLATIVLGVLFKVSGFKVSEQFPSLIQIFKQIQKDMISMKYHWFRDFNICRDMLYISMISLGTSILLAGIVPMLMVIPEDILKFNFNMWCVALIVHSICSFLIDTYIILFANMPIEHKIPILCQRCIAIAITTVYANYQLTNNGVSHPNLLFNKSRDFLGLPRAIDCNQLNQHRFMQKFLHEVSEKDYTYPTPGVSNSTTLSTKYMTEIARSNEDSLRAICTPDELQIFRINPK